MLVLAVDIGATSARFGLFQAGFGSLCLLAQQWVPSKEAKDFPSLLAQARQLSPQLAQNFEMLCVAAPGPVSKGSLSVCPTNLPYTIDIGPELEKIRSHGLSVQGFLINDFQAQAWFCLSPKGLELQSMQGKSFRLEPGQNLAIIGAGTGLGMAQVFAGPPAAVFSSEGGHCLMPFVTEQEQAFGKFAAFALNQRSQSAGAQLALSGDTLVCGNGLALIHEFYTGEKLSPAQVSQSIKLDSPTFRLFSRFYARVCRHAALSFMPGNGLVITGGVAAKNPNLFQMPEFLEEFYDSPTHGEILRQLPLYLNSNQDSGLWGAAFAAAHFGAGV